MSEIHVSPAPKFGARYEKPVKHKVGDITKDRGGIVWVRDELRHDGESNIVPTPMSDYWHKTLKMMFSKWPGVTV